MKIVILAAVVAASVVGFASSSDAQGTKKLKIHPDAAKDKSLPGGQVNVPKDAADGKAGDTVAKPTTGDAVASGGSSTASSNRRKLQFHPSAATDRSLPRRQVKVPKDAANGKAGVTVAKPTTGDAVASGGSSTASSNKK